MPAGTRASNICDGCAFRHVRCEGGHPCQECVSHSVCCTFLRARKKRGPKGPRLETRQRIQSFQRTLHEDHDPNAQHGSAEASARSQSISTADEVARETSALHRIPLCSYLRYLEIYRPRLYSVWPIVHCEGLIRQLEEEKEDLQSYSLAAALCAAVIAQLRLPEHLDNTTPSSECTSSKQFTAEAERLRTHFDHREHYSICSLLTSFFLHIYFANADKLRTAGFFLREALTYCHGLGLHKPGTYANIEPAERQLRLRVYWVLFVSERTYCVQNGLPTTLNVIHELPSAEALEGCDNAPIPAFLSLTRLFTVLEGGFVEGCIPSSHTKGSDEQHERISVLQQALQQEYDEEDLCETQQVDLSVTRNWIRILLWQYTITHFAVSCYAQDQAFSALLPALIACDMLSLFTKVSPMSIQPHGYGMEIKIFRVADSLLDVLVCAPTSAKNLGLLVQARNSLHALENVLVAVGGPASQFLAALRDRMAGSGLPVASTLCADLQISHALHRETEGANSIISRKQRLLLY